MPAVRLRRLTPAQSLILDGVRYLAALMVVLHHGLAYFYGPDYRAISQISFFTNLGSMGVAIFFVLSGFVICYSAVIKRADSQEYCFQRFAIERIVRIYLVFAPAMLVAVAINFVNLMWIGDNIVGAPFFTARHFATTLAMLSGIVDSHAEIMPLMGPAWSLNYEFWLYMLFGLLVLPLKGVDARVGFVIRFALFIVVAFLASHLTALLLLVQFG